MSQDIASEPQSDIVRKLQIYSVLKHFFYLKRKSEKQMLKGELLPLLKFGLELFHLNLYNRLFNGRSYCNIKFNILNYLTCVENIQSNRLCYNKLYNKELPLYI